MTAAQQRVINAAKGYVAAVEERWSRRANNHEEYVEKIVAMAKAETELGQSVLALRVEEV